MSTLVEDLDRCQQGNSLRSTSGRVGPGNCCFVELPKAEQDKWDFDSTNFDFSTRSKVAKRFVPSKCKIQIFHCHLCNK
ncbi:hypothetical protein T05_11607 [Trichinella murrelli]|uniref:Uncharacterized protein n=1 Tax=Trichinella murrelli TaxID=144512 RepID=A0A0V0TV86_9BILA|nr:hypothetical protein T05_11607 [Trichinella murrelli]